MKIKKTSANWYIIMTHLLTIVVTGLIFAVLMGMILGLLNVSDTISQTVFLIVFPIIMWFAVKYSASFINNNYVIKDANRIVIFSTIDFLILNLLLTSKNIFSNNLPPLDLIGTIVAIIIVYLASKRYIKENVNSNISPQK
jgi:hypothetical protein